MDAPAVRVRIGAALRLARGTESVHSAGASGLGYRVVDRLERGANDGIELSAVYLLALHYGVSLGAVLQIEVPVLDREDLGTWPTGAPSLPDTEAYLRTRFREYRRIADIGTPKLARLAGVHQPWVVRFELGSVARCDLVRVAACCDVLGGSPMNLLPPEFWTKRRGGRRVGRRRDEARDRDDRPPTNH